LDTSDRTTLHCRASGGILLTGQHCTVELAVGSNRQDNTALFGWQWYTTDLSPSLYLLDATFVVIFVALCFVVCHKWAVPIVCASFIIRNSRCKRLQITDTILMWLRIKLFRNFAYGCRQGHLPVELQLNFVLG